MRQPFDSDRHAASGAQPAGSASALHALALIARRVGIDVSYSEIRRNYALDEGEPKTSMLLAVAADLGLEAKSIKVPFKQLPRLQRSLPAIIRATNGACLVLEAARQDPKAGLVAILRDPTVEEESLTAV